MVCATVIIPWARLRTGDAASTATCGAASTSSTVPRRSVTGCERNGFTDVRSETVPGWQRNIVHTFLGRGSPVTDPRRAAIRLRPACRTPTHWRATPRVVVVGAGIAGLAAATGLAERGVAVDVIERETYLGGRVGGWTENGRRRHRRWR